VGAAVEQQVDLAVLVAAHDDRLRADRLHDVVVRLGDLADVPDEDPGRVPDAVQLGLVDGRVRIEGAVDAVVLDQGIPVRHLVLDDAHARRIPKKLQVIRTICPSRGLR